MTIDLNRANITAQPLNQAIETLLGKAAEQEQQPRSYLGASLIGDECLRKVQYSWQCTSRHAARTQRIFARGHAMEEATADILTKAGFRIERGTLNCSFQGAGGLFRGHCDGIIHEVPSHLEFETPAIWECKWLGERGWKKLEKEGLEKAYPTYAAQIAIYQAYLDLPNPALLTAGNANTCEVLHILVPFNVELAQATSDRAVTVLEATAANELLPRAFNQDDWRCRMCSHKERCWSLE